MQRVTSGLLAVALALAVLLTIQWAAPAAPGLDRSHVFQTWSESLNRRAQFEAERARAERVNGAWSDRLNGIAQYLQAQEGMSERAEQAWSERLSGIARYQQAQEGMSERAEQAWSGRLSAIARYQQAQEGMSERAEQAWSERLTGLARHRMAADVTNP